jgi:hypothetical protein
MASSLYHTNTSAIAGMRIQAERKLYYYPSGEVADADTTDTKAT